MHKNLFVIAALLSVGCVDAPSAPARQADLSADYAAFDHPTALLSEASVPTIAGAFARGDTLPEGTGAFGLIRQLVSDSNRALADQAGLLDQFTVDGSATASLPCTANATTPPTVSTASVSFDDGRTVSLSPSATVVGGSTTGLLTFALGVENSKVQRTLRGSALNCALLLLGSSALPAVTTGSADLTVDLGEDLELGAALTLPILVQATNVRTDSGTATAALTAGGYEARVTEDGAVELLVQPSTFGISVEGTIVVTLFTDGTIGVRDQRGAWTCTKDGASCALSTS